MPETFRPPGAPRSVWGVPARSRPPAFRRRARRVPPSVASPCALVSSSIPGGHCAGAPPLPIPNREVKPGCADGTAPQCGRVGGRRLFFSMASAPGDIPRRGRLAFACPPRRQGGLCGSPSPITWHFCIRQGALGVAEVPGRIAHRTQASSWTRGLAGGVAGFRYHISTFTRCITLYCCSIH